MGTQTSRPFQGTSTGDSGAYSSAQWARVWQHMFNGLLQSGNNGVLAKSNVGGAGNGLVISQSSPASKVIEVSTGAAFVTGYFYELSDSVETFTISDNNDANARIDSVILRLNLISQTVRLAVLEGTPAASPVAPTLTQSATVWEIRLANIAVASLFTTIVDANIDNSVRFYANVSMPQEGGTGLEGGYVAGDLIVSSGINTLEILTDGGDYRYPIGNTSAGVQYVFASQRSSYVRYINSVTSDPVVSPIPINDSDDSEGNFRAVISSNRFYPKARKLKISGALTYMNSNTTRFDNYLYLYDVNAAANITDIDGNLVRTQTSITNVNLADKTFIWQDQIVDFDGTEDVEIRIANTFVGFFASLTNASLVHFLSLRRVG